MGKRVKNKVSLQIDIPEETKLELEDIREIFQNNDPYNNVSLSKVIMILIKEKHRYYRENGFLTVEEQKNKPIISHKQTRLNLQNKAKNTIFDKESTPITIQSIKEDRKMEEEEMKNLRNEIEEWKKNIK